jgi:drug/metabolite transporter (DMT)-like permease
MLAGALAFTLMGAFTHALGTRCDWLIVALVRTIFMFFSAAGLALSAGVRLSAFDPPRLWVRSVAGSCSLVCNFYALARLPMADAVTLSNLYPLWIVLATAFLLGRAPTLGEAIGLVCGLTGVVLIERPDLDGDRVAALAAIGASVSTAVAMFGLHRLRNVDSRAVVAHFAAVGALVAGVWSAFRPEARWEALLDPTTALLLLGVGIFGTTGQVCLTRAYDSGVPNRVAVISLAQVPFAMALDVLVWGRGLPPITLLGFAMVLLPTAWLMMRGAVKLATRGPSPLPEPIASRLAPYATPTSAERPKG